MDKKRALIVVRVDPPADKEAEWNEWYNSKHILDRLAVPGFLFARRFVAVGARPKYLTLYDLAEASVLNDGPYLGLRDWEQSQAPDSFWAITSKLPNFSRGLYEQVYPEGGEYRPPPSEFVFIAGHDVPPNREDEFNAWYNTEHIPAMLRVPGFLSARRFKAFRGEVSVRTGAWPAESMYFSVYDLASEKAMESPEFMKEKDSPWSSWVRSWYTKKLRGLYRRIFPAP